jgi:CBS domain containing-hemolysin-like protein
MTVLANLAIIILLLVLSGFLSCSETALFSLSRIEKKRLFETHTSRSKRVHALLETPRKTLLSILIGNLTVNTLAAAIVTVAAMHYLRPEWVGVMMAIFTVILIFVGEILPKSMAVRHNEKIALVSALPLRVIVWLLTPLRILFKSVTDRMMALILRDRKMATDILSEEELKTLVKIGEEDGVLETRERQMIQKIFELGERPVKDIMIPRIDVLALDIEDPVEKHLAVIRKRHFSHIPVYQETIDHILGVVSVQEYVLYSGKKALRELLKEPLYVPETKRIDDVLDEFKNSDNHFAVCIDEHGGTDGIVTMEDILEEIFGEYYDEYETPQNPIRRLGHHEFLVEGKVSLAEFNDYFQSHLESEKASTLGGFILERLGELPAKGKALEAEGFEMVIDHVIRHRIHQVKVRSKS